MGASDKEHVEQIVERLIEDKSITAKEAVILLNLLAKANIPYYIPVGPSYPEPNYPSTPHEPFPGKITFGDGTQQNSDSFFPTVE